MALIVYPDPSGPVTGEKCYVFLGSLYPPANFRTAGLAILLPLVLHPDIVAFTSRSQVAETTSEMQRI